MDFSTFLASVRRYVLRIVVLSAGAGAVVYFASGALPKSYTAEARLYVGSLSVANYDQQLAYENLAQTYAQLATTTPVIERVRSALNLTDAPEQLAERLDVRAPAGLSIIRIGASAPTSAEAAAIANAMGEQLVNLAGTIEGSQTELVSIVQPALPPPNPSSPRPALNAIVAIALTLAIGLLLAALVYRRRHPGSPPTSPVPAWPEPQLQPTWRRQPLGQTVPRPEPHTESTWPPERRAARLAEPEPAPPRSRGPLAPSRAVAPDDAPVATQAPPIEPERSPQPDGPVARLAALLQPVDAAPPTPSAPTSPKPSTRRSRSAPGPEQDAEIGIRTDPRPRGQPQPDPNA